MGGQIAIIATEAAQLPAQQDEMLGLFLRHLQPVAVKIIGKPGKAANRIQREIDGVEFNVSEGMEQAKSTSHSGQCATPR